MWCKAVSFVALSSVFLFIGCGEDGDDVSKSNNAIDVVASVNELPDCSDANEGEQIIVREDGSVRYCIAGEWKLFGQSVENSSESVMLSSSSAEPLSASEVVSSSASNSGEDDVVESSSSAEPDVITDKTISGVSQKGPFVKGAKVTVHELKGGKSLVQSGRTFGGEIVDNDGKFSVLGVSLVSSHVRLEAEGFFRNEVTGKDEQSKINLNAYSDLNDRDRVNVNLLTHLEYFRVRQIMAESDGSMRILQAKKIAQAEIFKAFHINATDAENSEDLDIFGTSDGDAALMAISVLLLGNRNVVEFTELLSTVSQDIQKEGLWKNEALRTLIADWADSVDNEYVKDPKMGYGAIEANVLQWGLSSTVPDFKKYVHNFWVQEYGLGSCDAAHEGFVVGIDNKYSVNDKSKTKNRFICKNSVWRRASEIEKANFAFSCKSSQATSKDGKKHSMGDILTTVELENSYVCDGDELREPKQIESYVKQGCVSGALYSQTVENKTLKCSSGLWKWSGLYEAGLLIDERDGQTYLTTKIVGSSYAR